MTRDPEDYLDAQANVQQIVTAVTAARDRAARSIDQMNQAFAALDTLDNAAPAGYLGTVAFVTSEAAANPGDAAWQTLKAELDNIVANFQTTKAELQAQLNALAAL